MQQRCTCGAVLPEDARFCHKCGKPQYEEDIARLSVTEEPKPAVQPSTPPKLPTPAGISFRNSTAVAVSMLVAAGAFVGLIAIALLAAPLSPLILCAAGFVAARVYSGRLRQPLTTAAGARLGWMTGLWLFLVFVVACAIVAIYVASPDGWQQLKAVWSQLPQASKLLDMSQHDFLMQLLLDIPIFFFLLTLLPGLGGMLGAKMSVRRRSL